MRAVLAGARIVRRAEMYASDGLRIVRVETDSAGIYFLVNESDTMLDEDYEALRRLDLLLFAPWRNRVVETDFYGHPHKRFPLSTKFAVHLVHPEFTYPDKEAYGQPFCGRSGDDPFRKSGRAVQEVPATV
jgi:hypothetical protein